VANCLVHGDNQGPLSRAIDKDRNGGNVVESGHSTMLANMEITAHSITTNFARRRVFDPSFVFCYSLGGGLVMPFFDPLIWVPALIIGRISPKRLRFWMELPFGSASAFFIGWYENGFASMARLSGTVQAIQFVRPAFAIMFASLAASAIWKVGKAIVATGNASATRN
jgi:hypothetical protein